MSVSVNMFNLDPTQNTVLIGFSGPEITMANLGIRMQLNKHETLEKAEHDARHKAAELLEQVAKSLREPR